MQEMLIRSKWVLSVVVVTRQGRRIKGDMEEFQLQPFAAQ
jgi:hypothetical protein